MTQNGTLLYVVGELDVKDSSQRKGKLTMKNNTTRSYNFYIIHKSTILIRILKNVRTND